MRRRDVETASGTAALERGLSVFDHVIDAQRPLRFSELLSETGLPKATLHRMLSALVARRLVAYDPEERTYAVGLRALESAQRIWEELDVRKAAASAIRELAGQTGETVHLAVREGANVICIDKIESPKQVRLYSAIGKPAPVYCTGLGKAILAYCDDDQVQAVLNESKLERHTSSTIYRKASLISHLKEVRSRGFAFDFEEHVVGTFCVAAPIFDFRGRAIAAISVTCPSFRCDVAFLHKITPNVLAATLRATAQLGGCLQSVPTP